MSADRAEPMPDDRQLRRTEVTKANPVQSRLNECRGLIATQSECISELEGRLQQVLEPEDAGVPGEGENPIKQDERVTVQLDQIQRWITANTTRINLLLQRLEL